MTDEQGLRLCGDRALVTGAARGIGFAIAERLHQLGASVILNDLDVGDLEEARARLEDQPAPGAGAKVLLLEGDAGRQETAAEAIALAGRELGGLDILVNNAGITEPWLAVDMPLEAWEQTIRVNLTGPFLLSQAFVRAAVADGRGGRIVNVSSIAGKRISVHGGSAYTASKAGLLGLTRHLAFECAPHGITVNAVCPGGVSTPSFDALTNARGREKRLAQIPLGRFLAASDIGDAVALLVSDRASAITGVALDVDGGSLLGWEPAAEYERWMRDRHEERAAGGVS
jgi:NAD(P)-dependent dehydrogenase (short-subunit alcohol dehydrogenase family)